MRKRFRKITSVVMTLAIIAFMIPYGAIPVNAYSIPNENEFASKIAELQSRFVDGKYWNKYSSSDYSHTGDTPCTGYGLTTHVACTTRGYCADSNGLGCSCLCGAYVLNGVEKAWQCMGFAYKMGHECFGVSPYNWEKSTSIGTVYAGDIIRINGDRHSIFVYKVDGSTIYYADCNRTGPCRVSWGNTYSYSELSSRFKANDFKLHLSGNNLNGCGKTVPYARPSIVRTYINYQQAGTYRVNVEVTNVESISSVQVATWTQQNQSDLHWNTCTFNGGATFFVDLSRADFTANQTSYCNDVYVYDTRGECVGYERIGTIYNNPAIVRTYINYQQANSYRVNIEVTNVESISSVRVATWTQQDQSDLHWNTCYFNGGATYFIDLSRTDFAANQKEYCNDVYIYDGNGNCVDYDRIGTIYTTPTIADIRVTQISNNGYRVVCKMNSQFGIASAQLPTWTEKNGQDDLVWHDGTISGNYISCYIKSSDHNNEKNNYITHLYITDNIGQYVSFSGILPYIDLSIECREISTCRYMNNKYVLYNKNFTWEEAKVWCENQGGHLVCIQDESEWNAVKKQLEDYGGISVWLGAKNNSGIWNWVTGESMSYNEWAPSQPDNMGGIENYLGTINPDGFLDCYEWNDYQNTDSVGGFICEFENFYLLGDANRDGYININDVTAIQRHLVELELFTEEKLALADTNGDGEINIADATHLQMYLAEYDGIVLGKQ